MLGGIKVNENWRKRYNKELVQLFGIVYVYTFVFFQNKSVELDWAC